MKKHEHEFVLKVHYKNAVDKAAVIRDLEALFSRENMDRVLFLSVLDRIDIYDQEKVH